MNGTRPAAGVVTLGVVHSESTRRRVLILTKSDGVGGVERNLAWFVPALRASGVDADVETLQRLPQSRTGSVPGLLESLEPAVFAGGSRGAVGLLKQLAALRRRSRSYDAVIGTGPAANLLICLAVARRGPMTVIAEQNDPFIQSRLRWNRRWLWAMRRARAVTVHTEALADELRVSSHYPKRLAVIPNAVDPGAELTDPLGPRDRVLCGVGRLTVQKGFDDLVRAFAGLGELAVGWSLLLVGDGPERERLTELADELGIGDRLTITGMVPAPWSRIDRAAVFALCSHHEGFGNVILEAMAAGCAIVVSDCRFGPREIVRHGIDGAVYRAGDVNSLTTALASLIDNEEHRRGLAVAGQQRLAEYSVDRVVADWLDLLGFASQASSGPAQV